MVTKPSLKILLDLGEAGTLSGVVDIQSVGEPDVVFALNDDDSHLNANDMNGFITRAECLVKTDRSFFSHRRRLAVRHSIS